MSLVERALKKIQEQRAAAPKPVARPAAHAAAVAGPLEETVDIVPRLTQPIPVKEAVQPAPPPRPTRTVHINHAALRAAEILPPPDKERQLANEYRHIKRPLIASALGRGEQQLKSGHLIMMASALPGDGKTFTSINLALSLALEKDISVVLIDGDVAKPHISRILQIDTEPGLLDVLSDETMDVESVILPTDVPRLSVVSAGKRNENASELLASGRMAQLLATLGSRDPNRIILLDSPPLLLTSESRVLAAVVGQVVMVVRAGVTPQRAVFDAIDLLGEGKPVSLVLNQSDEQNAPYYHQYYGSEGPGAP